MTYKPHGLLTTHKWKWKSTFITYSCHKIYRGKKTICLKSSNYIFKTTISWKCELWGNFLKIWYFGNNSLIKISNLKILFYISDSYNWGYLQHTIFRFYSIDFKLNADFPSQFCVFTVKSPNVSQRSVSKLNAFKKIKNPSPFFSFFLFFFPQNYYRLK